ncbi:uncharacterized protein N7483_003918 [Penicillium malachiteum]|uniref:uncharacterized protein n=1 Tax=Penicillium malachiteum TaxID=1324776 RepID=UPI00254725D9|nr:uncharacterized protein N7483_003918 [Penicillium malachiteum]KAJ5729410.1 hypothetical protein N7483_003918 [Penicillium malachiteum]
MMFSKIQALALINFIALSSAYSSPHCNVEFYSVSDCSGTPDASCVPDDMSDTECTWNTWVGSIYYSGCGTQESPSFVGCNGDPGVCANAWSIAIPGASAGCVEIGTYDGFVTVYDNNPAGCGDCVGTEA